MFLPNRQEHFGDGGRTDSMEREIVFDENKVINRHCIGKKIYICCPCNVWQNKKNVALKQSVTT